MNNKVATCGSFSCTGIQNHRIKNSDYVKKDVPRGTLCCKDCGHALVWFDESKSRRMKTVYRSTVVDGRRSFDLNGAV